MHECVTVFYSKNTRRRWGCEHFILRIDLRAAGEGREGVGGDLQINVVPLYAHSITFMVCVSMLELCPSATLRLHIEAVPHYIMKSQASDLFQCNVQCKCSPLNCSQMFCTPLCPTSCCSRLFSLYYRGETWHGVSV